jgi:hypothetical protein
MDLETFIQDRKTFFAATRTLETVSEAALKAAVQWPAKT